jgi:hypothetical protein
MLGCNIARVDLAVVSTVGEGAVDIVVGLESLQHEFGEGV